MSVMLRTTNPQAIDEIEPDRDRRVPYLGQMLVFHARPGEGRGGKLANAAICTHLFDEDHVELVVIYAADDFVTRMKIPRKSDQNNMNCWSFNEVDEKHYLRPPPAPPTISDINKLFEERTASLSAKIASLEGEMRRLLKPLK